MALSMHRACFIFLPAFLLIKYYYYFIKQLVCLQSTSIFIDEPCIFTALHGMQTRSSDEYSVRLSVRQTREL